jgi:dolichol-phosphate mannosyltransferase
MAELVRKLSVAAPAYNEAAGIELIVQHWADYLRATPGIEAFEIIVCNDGSRDNTGAILDRLAARNPELQPVHHTKNAGAAAAFATAIRKATGDWILLIDSYGQFPIENLPRMIESLRPGVSAVVGVRTRKEDSTFMRAGSWLSGTLCNWFHHTHYRDFNSVFKLVQGDLLRSLSLEVTGLNSSGEVTSKLLERGVQLGEAEILHRRRESGVSTAKNFRAAAHRLLFVFYVGVRQFLFRMQVLQRMPPSP